VPPCGRKLIVQTGLVAGEEKRGTWTKREGKMRAALGRRRQGYAYYSTEGEQASKRAKAERRG
jgi:hypothetical protein